LTLSGAASYRSARMMHLVATAASSIARRWWRGRTDAARWRD
jgi:hypothetical protein